MLFFIFITRTFEENKQKQTKENNNNNNVQKKQQPINKKKDSYEKQITKNKILSWIDKQLQIQTNRPPHQIWLGGSYLLTCHNWSTGNVVVKKLSKVGQIWREAGADLDLIVTVVDHITDPPGAGEGVAVYTFNPRHFDT